MKTKICATCGVEKNISEFNKKIGGRHGVVAHCRTCLKIERRQYYKDKRDKFKEYHKKYYNANRKEIIKHQTEYTNLNKENIKLYHDEWRSLHKNEIKNYCENNKHKLREYSKEWRSKNYDRATEYDKEYGRTHRKEKREYKKRKYYNDENYKIEQISRSRIVSALKRKSTQKQYYLFELIGCTIDELKKHIESQFKPGMTWKNWNHKTWHVDHIKPIASFDLTKPEEQKKAFHFSNLQPLWAEENLKKGAKYVA
jgi:hypothetical protein